MLTYDKVPQDVKNTVIGILSDEGVNFETLSTCAAGLMLENQIQLGNVPADSHDNATEGIDLQVAEAEQGNLRNYTELALEIYARAINEAIGL